MYCCGVQAGCDANGFTYRENVTQQQQGSHTAVCIIYSNTAVVLERGVFITLAKRVVFD